MMKVGIQGGKGSFNEEALAQIAREDGFDGAYETVYCKTTENTLRAVSSGEVKYGVFAIYNSQSLLVDETASILGHIPFDVVRYVTIPVKYCLMTLHGINLENVTRVMGHEEAIIQCHENLMQNFDNEKIASGKRDLIDGACAAAALVAGDTRVPHAVAVLGSRAIASTFELDIVAENLEDNSNNTTTFLFVQAFTEHKQKTHQL